MNLKQKLHCCYIVVKICNKAKSRILQPKLVFHPQPEDCYFPSSFFWGGGGGVLNMLSLFSFPARFGGEIARSTNIEYVAIKTESYKDDNYLLIIGF